MGDSEPRANEPATDHERPRTTGELGVCKSQLLNLGRLGFVNERGERLSASDVRVEARYLELWSGLLTSHFSYLGEPVKVQTCVDPQADIIAVHVESPLLSEGRLRVMLDFPAPALYTRHGWCGDFSKAAGHHTAVVRQSHNRLEFHRTADDAQYDVVLSGSGWVAGQPAAIQPEIESARYGTWRTTPSGTDGRWLKKRSQSIHTSHRWRGPSPRTSTIKV